MERITSEVIAEKEFTIANRGYNQEAVSYTHLTLPTNREV